MNIFFLDTSVQKSAEYHCNRHVIKLILESAQLSCTCHRFFNTQNLPDKFYKTAMPHHPINKWLQKSIENYLYCVDYGLALCNEYTYRYNKIHTTQSMLEWLKNNIPNISSYYFTEPPQCMPLEYQVPGNVVQAYRNYYKYDKQHNIQFEYKKREKPSWII